MKSLKQWDVVKVRINPTDRDEHFAIVLSPSEIAGGNWPKVNVLYGSTKRPAIAVRPGQFLLDTADGVEHLTVFECVFFPVVLKTQISAVVGSVSLARRRPLQKVIAESLRLFS